MSTSEIPIETQKFIDQCDKMAYLFGVACGGMRAILQLFDVPNGSDHCKEKLTILIQILDKGCTELLYNVVVQECEHESDSTGCQAKGCECPKQCKKCGKFYR